MPSPAYKSGTIFANGINIHYLDWGGSGPNMIFLAGLGCNSYIFTEFAPRFTDKFRVLALDRRGHGDSDHPETGYDLANLTEDLRQSMDALGIDRAMLVGHSLAGIELTPFAQKYPERTAALIYLDSAYDYGLPEYRALMAKNPMRNIEFPGMKPEYESVEECEAAIRYAYAALDAIWGPAMHENLLHEVKVNEEGKVIDRATDGINAAIGKTSNSFLMGEGSIQAPVLSFFVLTSPKYYTSRDFLTPEQKEQITAWFKVEREPWYRSWAEEFKRRVPQAQVVVIPDGHHYCFVAQEEVVYAEMRRFLDHLAEAERG